MELAARYGLEELEVEEAGFKVTLYAEHPYTGDDEQPDTGGRGYLWQPPDWLDAAGPKGADNRVAVLAPLTGTFYRSESPDAPPLVEVGDTVEEGQKIGLIEAMKVFSEVVADQAGVVAEFAVQNGRLVQRDEVLLYIEPAA